MPVPSKYIFSRNFLFWKKASLLPPQHCLQVNPHIPASPTLMQWCFYPATPLTLQTLICSPLLALHFPLQSSCTFPAFFRPSGRNRANPSATNCPGVSRGKCSPQLLQSSLSGAPSPKGAQGSWDSFPLLNDLPGGFPAVGTAGKQQHAAAASVSQRSVSPGVFLVWTDTFCTGNHHRTVLLFFFFLHPKNASEYLKTH